MIAESRKDRIYHENEDGMIILPIAHYALINSTYHEKVKKPKIAIYGLGSCMALILYDCNKNIYAMSHILLPLAEDKNPTFPHKFANTSVLNLIADMKSHGADTDNIRSIIVGGSKIFQNHVNNIGAENSKSLKSILNELNIKLEKEDIGGTRGRIIIYDTNTNQIFLKKTGEKEFRVL